MHRIGSGTLRNVHPARGFDMGLDDIVRDRVNEFHRHEEVMREHHEAMECYECEDFLQLGIDAFHWLIRLDRRTRRAVLSGEVEHSEATDEELRNLFRRWLEACRDAHNSVRRQQQRGYDLENLGEFENCYEEARAIVDAFETVDELPQSFVALRDEALEDSRHGQTAEFI